MAGKSAVLSVRIIADGKQAGREFRQTNDEIGKFEEGLNKANTGALIAAGGILYLANAAGQAASSAEQAAGAVESVFGTYATEVKKYAADAAENVGLAEAQYNQLASVLGAQLKNMGIPMEAVSGQTNDLIGLGADLAATFGGTTADAVAALSSLLRGERDPIERYAVGIKAADVAARVAAMGLGDLEGEALKAAETQATLTLLTEQTADAQGQFAREADTAAGAQERANAKWADASANLGEALLPVMSEAATILAEVAQWVSENTELVTLIAAVVLSFASAILIANGALTAYRTIAAIATAAQVAWNVAMTANPIGLIILGIAALVAAIVWLIANWESVSKVAEDVFSGIVGWIENVIGWVKEAVDWFGSLFGAQNTAAQAGAQAGAVGIGGFDDDNPAIPPAGTWTPFDDSLVAYHLAAGDDVDGFDGTGGWESWSAPFTSAGAAQPAGDVHHWTINGAVDVDGTARTIEKVLERHARKTGRPMSLTGGDSSWR